MIDTSNRLKVPNNETCLCWRDFNWFCSSEVSERMIDSQSLITVSLMPSWCNLNRSFSVETTTSSKGVKSLLVKTWGKRSLAASSASTQAALSSLDTQRKWRVFVPVNMESLLSSDLLARMEETYNPKYLSRNHYSRDPANESGHHTLFEHHHAVNGYKS